MSCRKLSWAGSWLDWQPRDTLPHRQKAHWGCKSERLNTEGCVSTQKAWRTCRACWARGLEMAGSSKCCWPTNTYAGEGAMLALGLLWRSLTKRPERGLLGGGVLGLLNMRRCFRVSGGSDDCLLTHQYLTLIRGCRMVFPTCILSHRQSLFQSTGWQRPERSHCLVVGPRAAGHSGKLAQKMICTMKSPLNHCLSPVPGLLFLLCSPETFL